MSEIAVDKKIKCRNLQDYLKTLPGVTLERLYTHPATCLAVFRELPELARLFVMRVLFIERPVTQAVVASWVKSSHHKLHLASAESLRNLHLWQDEAVPGGLPGWMLNDTFKKNLRIALVGGGKPWNAAASLAPDRHVRDIQFLDNYALERWECVLHYMVGSQSNEGISADTVRILLHSGLMKNDEEGGNPTITTEGFQFLLMSTGSQLWYFMMQYLDTVESCRNMDLVDCLSFLFQLSFSSLGRNYSTDGMSESSLTFLQHLREFGLVYQRKRRSGRFYPTRLVINLTLGIHASDLDRHRPGYIVVETNYRVYAYTDSELQIALIGLFCELMCRFPNLSVGTITRESVRQALRSGITADQIISFLKMHAHPEAAKQTPVIPPTITDQIKLWEMERDRFLFSEGVLYNQFLSQTDFECLRDYAQDLGVLVWENPSKRMMVVNRSGHDEVKRFWKRQKNC